MVSVMRKDDFLYHRRVIMAMIFCRDLFPRPVQWILYVFFLQANV